MSQPLTQFELLTERTPELDLFWQCMGGAAPFTEDRAGFHYRYWREAGRITAAVILQPFEIVHLAHICSSYRSKKLIKFCQAVLESFKPVPEIGLLVVNTRNQRPDVDRLVSSLGFQPVETEFGIEYYWPSKQLTLY